jgi:beta-phosphoglucomutase family hydrolase
MKKFVISPEIKGLIFDCDGTIADTMPLHFEAYQEALGANGQYFDKQMFYDQAGVPAIQVMELLKKKYDLDFDAEAVGVAKEKLFGDMLKDGKIKAVAAVEAVVRDNFGKYPMAVASGGTRENVVQILQIVGLLDFFQTIVPAEEVREGKPAPDMFIEAARRLNVAPGDCLVFEDGEKGFEAAAAAGMAWVDVRPWYGEEVEEIPL